MEQVAQAAVTPIKKRGRPFGSVNKPKAAKIAKAKPGRKASKPAADSNWVKFNPNDSPKMTLDFGGIKIPTDLLRPLQKALHDLLGPIA